MAIEALKKILAKDTITVEEQLEGLDLLQQLADQLDSKEVIVQEPDDIDDEVVMVWTKEQLNKLREAAVVAIANDMGIDASAQDKKADTIQKILDTQAAAE